MSSLNRTSPRKVQQAQELQNTASTKEHKLSMCRLCETKMCALWDKACTHNYFRADARWQLAGRVGDSKGLVVGIAEPVITKK